MTPALRRLSIRARLTVAFIAALAIVLALAALWVYLRTEAELTGALDDGLQVRAADLAGLVAAGGPESPELTGTLFEGEEGFSEILTTDGEVVASKRQPGAGAAIDTETLDRATREPVLVEGLDVPGLDGEGRVLARPASSSDRSFVVVAGASTGDRGEALAGIAGAFLVGAPLALALAGALGNAGRAAFHLIRRLREELKVNTTCGASNISFGLPNRHAMNATFLAMAIGAGMTAAIMNPLHAEETGAIKGADVLMGHDRDCRRWLRTYRAPSAEGDDRRERRRRRA